jgi:PIN domain nuclease of toxin-antitoxin system
VRTILDAAAVVAFLNRESGHEQITEALAAGAGLCAANAAEVIAVLIRRGLTVADASQALDELPLTIIDVDLDLALRAGVMERPTRSHGLSLGDRLCLALAARERLPAITTDRAWAQAGPLVGVEVRLIR